MSSSDPIQDEILAAKIAAITVATPSVGIKALSTQLGVGITVVRRILASEGYRSLMSNMARGQIAPILDKVKSDIFNLGQEAVRVLKARLADDDLEAAKVVLKVMALDAPVDAQPDTQLTVIVPGVRQEKEVLSETK